MTRFAEPEKCALCGNTDKRELRWGLVHWKNAEPGMAYEHVGRCRDVMACKARVDAQVGRSWPLFEKGSAA